MIGQSCPASVANIGSATVTLVVSRRSLLLGGVGSLVVAGVGLAATDRLDDVLRLAGARPKPRPDAHDIALAENARAEADQLVQLAIAERAPEAVIATLEAQAAGLPHADRTAVIEGALKVACDAAAGRRADDALAARSSDLAVVLGSLSSGLAQVASVLGQGR